MGRPSRHKGANGKDPKSLSKYLPSGFLLLERRLRRRTTPSRAAFFEDLRLVTEDLAGETASAKTIGRKPTPPFAGRVREGVEVIDAGAEAGG